MTLSDTAAAYGLFQVVCADLIDHLAVAVFRLRISKEPWLAFETVFRQEFKRTLKEIRRELRQFEDRSSVSDSLAAVRGACKVMSKLAVWRNDRVHARVRLTEEGYALYDWRTRRRLAITRAQIEQNIQVAIKAIVDLEAHVPHLVHLSDWDAEFERLFSTVSGLSVADDNAQIEPADS